MRGAANGYKVFGGSSDFILIFNILMWLMQKLLNKHCKSAIYCQMVYMYFILECIWKFWKSQWRTAASVLLIQSGVLLIRV